MNFSKKSFFLIIAFRWCIFLFSLTFERSDKENERNVEERDQCGQGDVAEGRATYSHTQAHHFKFFTNKSSSGSSHQDLSIQDHPDYAYLRLDGPFQK